MEINSTFGTNPYSTLPGTTPPVENDQLSEQNLEASQTSIDDQAASVVRDAFEVNLSQEAQQLSASLETTPTQTEPVQTVPQEPTDQEVQNSTQPAGGNPIINIVA